MVELRQLKHILLVAEHMSFTKAAIAAHISQPSISVSIKKAEDTLGVKIFLRNPHAFELTEDGKEVVTMARKVLQTYHKSMSSLSGQDKKEQGLVRFGTDSYLSRTVMEQLIPVMNRKHSGIRFQVSFNPWQDLLRAVRNDELDFIIIVYSRLDDYPDEFFDKWEIHIPKAAYFVRPNHPLASSRIDSRQIGDYPWVGNVVSPQWARWALMATDVTEEQMRNQFLARVNDYDKTIDLVQENDAIGGHVHDELIPHEESGKIKILDIDWYIPHLENIATILCLKNKEPSHLCRITVEEFKSYSKKWKN